MDILLTPSPTVQPINFLETATMTNVLALIAVAISFFALIVNAFFSYKSYKQVTTINTLNMEAEYYQQIFDDYIINHIPKARQQLSFDTTSKLTQYSVTLFHNHLTDLLDNIHFFRFRNVGFYKDLHAAITDLDDYLVNNGNISMNTRERRNLFFDEVDKRINRLYSSIFNSYLCK
ncbi:MAG: hypothetical protein J1F01_02510 [Oscillospiraceae bacterium]|nr:hypothetical protein [Oscillospiraceae bacterium]